MKRTASLPDPKATPTPSAQAAPTPEASEQPADSASEAEAPVVETDSPFTQETVAKALAGFWETADTTAKQKTIRGNTYEVDEAGLVITWKVHSAVQQDIYQELREPLTTYLRRAMGKPKLLMEHRLEEVAQERKPYTNQEKFQHLLEKQPNLKDLVDKLGLDPDL